MYPWKIQALGATRTAKDALGSAACRCRSGPVLPSTKAPIRSGSTLPRWPSTSDETSSFQDCPTSFRRAIAARQPRSGDGRRGRPDRLRAAHRDGRPEPQQFPDCRGIRSATARSVHGVDLPQALRQNFDLASVHQIGLGQQQAVGETDLGLSGHPLLRRACRPAWTQPTSVRMPSSS